MAGGGPSTHLDEVGGGLVPVRGQQLLLRGAQPRQQHLLGPPCRQARCGQVVHRL